MVRKQFGMSDADEVANDEVRAKIAELKELIPAHSSLSCIVIVNMIFLECLEVCVTSVGRGDLVETFVRACANPNIRVMCFLINGFETQLKKTIAFGICPEISAPRILK